MSKIETFDASEFWSELPDVLDEAEQLEESVAAETLIAFLEDFPICTTAT